MGVLNRLPSAKSAIRGCMVLQVVVAALLFTDDIANVLIYGTDRQAPVTGPVSPGDQRRDYRPRYAPFDPDRRGPGNRTQTLPRRMEFSLADEENPVIIASGQIDDGAADRFVQFLADHPEAPQLIALNSGGGEVRVALELGRQIRDGGFATTVKSQASCLSSCPYLLAGGTDRTVSREAWVGVHQHYFDENAVMPLFIAVNGIQQGQADTLVYLDAMGVDPMLTAIAMRTPPEDIYILVEKELLDFALATEVVD
ncbi:hypothetical protein [Pseudoruegeria sp. SK021]|uniref:COG3904 family protein n=1 Tax=Pseudoruegeria sp. SK021 TaxID=1933035 RepID=UPI000A259F9A|nr:hypothetical protein [Pseudoruegeria sp. SK021]OSP53977.1 hypothetical protein BV911_15060 [Pseudoruegeria sp. SK021]